MKKILFLVMFVLLLSGCTNQYNITFKGDKIDEEIISTILDSDIPKSTPEEIAGGVALDDQITPFIKMDQYPFPDRDDVKYDKDVKTNVNETVVTLKHSYTFDEYKESKAMKTCFQNAQVAQANGSYTFALKGKFYCLHGNQVEINFTTDKKVLNHNADKVTNDTYTWVINRDNAQKVDINIELSDGSNEMKSLITKIVLITLGCIVLFGGLFLYYKIQKGKELNSL